MTLSRRAELPSSAARLDQEGALSQNRPGMLIPPVTLLTSSATISCDCLIA
jgi:hypothetical protein